MEKQFINRVLELVNQERNQQGLNSLSLNNRLNNAADNHSESMAINDFFDHQDPTTSSQISDRVNQSGYSWSTVGENIAAGYSTPEGVFEGWLNSPGHRANILNPNFTEIGIGYEFLQNDTGQENYNHYWTQVFAAPQPGSNNGNPPIADMPTDMMPTEELPTDMMPTEELPTDMMPTEELPTDMMPTEEIPTDMMPTEELPTDMMPTEELPTDMMPTEELPTDMMPTEELPTDMMPTEELPTDMMPTEEIPTDMMPTEEIPTDMMPTEELPTDMMPTNNMHFQCIPMDNMFFKGMNQYIMIPEYGRGSNFWNNGRGSNLWNNGRGSNLWNNGRGSNLWNNGRGSNFWNNGRGSNFWNNISSKGEINSASGESDIFGNDMVIYDDMVDRTGASQEGNFWKELISPNNFMSVDFMSEIGKGFAGTNSDMANNTFENENIFSDDMIVCGVDAYQCYSMDVFV